MKMGRLSLFAAAVVVVLIMTVIGLVIGGWSPTPGPADVVNDQATGAAQAARRWLGFTPFTPQALSIGLVLVTSLLFLILTWALSARFVPPVTGRLAEMIPARSHQAEPRSLLELIEDMVAIQRRQHRELLERIERLEDSRFATPSEPALIARRPRRDEDWKNDDGAEPPQQPSRARPVFEAQPPPTPASLEAASRQAFQTLERDYSNLLSNPTAVGFRNFFQARNGVSVELSGERLVGGRGANALLHAVPVEGAIHALLPGYDLVSDFDTVYFAQRAMPEEAKLAFDFDIDGSRTLKLSAAGRAILSDDGGYRIDGRGRLGGLAA